jgi:hypothetical protein
MHYHIELFGWDSTLLTFFPGWLQTLILPISASRVPGIIDVSHHPWLISLLLIFHFCHPQFFNPSLFSLEKIYTSCVVFVLFMLRFWNLKKINFGEIITSRISSFSPHFVPAKSVFRKEGSHNYMKKAFHGQAFTLQTTLTLLKAYDWR